MVSAVPYNTLFLEACSEGNIIEFILRAKNVTDEADTNNIFIKEIKSIDEGIIFKLQELQMKIQPRGKEIQNAQSIVNSNRISYSRLCNICFLKRRSKQEAESDIEVDDKTYTLELMTAFVKRRLDEITKINLYDIGLSEEELKRRKQKKYELKKALKGCTYGDVNDKSILKN